MYDGTPTNRPLVELRDISKSFGATEALRRVSFDVLPGEVHVLAGENGAGKSTLIKILSGVHQDYEGSLWCSGRKVRFAGPPDAARAGIATIHQELSLVGPMTVTDNLLLGAETGSVLGLLSHRERARQTKQILSSVGLALDPNRPVEALPLADRQLLEIAKALHRKARVIVMDEPTSALSEREAEGLFERIEQLRRDGKGIVYISHRMEEIFRLADRFTILRDGQCIRSAQARDMTRDELVRTIAGRDVTTSTPSLAQPTGPVALRLTDVVIADPSRPGRRWVDGVSLEVAAGEVVGLAGLRGSGTSALLHGVFGSHGLLSAGSLRLGEQTASLRSPADAIAAGVLLLAADRSSSVVTALSVEHNTSLSSLPRLSRWGWVDRTKERNAVRELVDRLGVVAPSLAAPVSTLSGGNQQKVALARCLLTEPRVLLLDEPTRGIDVGAKADVYELIRQLSGEGVAVVLVASEMEELIELSHRVLVLYEGRQAALLERAQLSRDRILRAAMGAASEAA